MLAAQRILKLLRAFSSKTNEKIVGGLADSQGRVAGRREVPTPAKAGGSQILADSIALARHLRNGSVVFLALGTGIGGAIIIDGKLVRGAHWSGGELGHILVSMDDDARVDLGGATGTLEAYCSGPALVNIWRELSGRDSKDLSGYDVVADADQNPDGSGAKAIALIGKHLGFGLVTLANALDPDLIIIGGGLSALKERLLAPAVAVLKERAMPGPATCPVVTAELQADAAVVGAASLVIPQEEKITVMS